MHYPHCKENVYYDEIERESRTEYCYARYE